MRKGIRAVISNSKIQSDGVEFIFIYEIFPKLKVGKTKAVHVTVPFEDNPVVRVLRHAVEPFKKLLISFLWHIFFTPEQFERLHGPMQSEFSMLLMTYWESDLQEDIT